MSGLVVTSLGKIKGKSTRTKQGNAFYAFKGIPYAQPPLGELRFAKSTWFMNVPPKPKPVKPWNKTLDLNSKKESPICLQTNAIFPESKFLVGEEDCLYLNVFTPHLPGGGQGFKLPVIVYIHGGAFCLGSNDSHMYGPDFLLDYGIVLVTINYRLGPLGFLTLDKAPGNQGMHDQVLALKWVQEHIQNFGGNPKNVTIMGESAGAMSCFLHLISPLSRGLFHKIIALSGSPSTPFLHLDRQPQSYGKAFAQQLLKKKHNIEEFSDEMLLKSLKELPAKTLVENTTLFKDWDVANPMMWKPILDGDFMTMNFKDAIESGNFDKNIPIMTGCTSQEGLIFTTPFLKSPRRWTMLFNNWDHWAPLLLFNRETDLVTLDDITKTSLIKRKFFPAANENVPNMKDGSMKIMEQLFTTAIFHGPMVKDMSLLASKGVKIYAFEFGYQGSMTLADIFRLSPMKLFVNFFGRHIGTNLYQKDLGVCHGDDLFYIFPFSMFGFPKSLKNRSDKLTSQRLLTFITNFALSSNPGNVNSVEWKNLLPSADPEKFHVMKINKEVKFGVLEPNQQRRIRFWLDNIDPNGEKGSSWSQEPVNKIYHVIAERRSSILDSQQLFT